MKEISLDVPISCEKCKEKNTLKNSEFLKDNFSLLTVQKNFIEDSRAMYKKLIAIYGININLKYTEISDSKAICINAKSLLSLRENIINNAVNAGATDLDVHIQMKEYCLVITYSDNGKGMTQEEIDKIMLFKHGDGKVHGLGTKNILNIVEDHGFSISYHSIVNKGTTIRMLLPYR